MLLNEVACIFSYARVDHFFTVDMYPPIRVKYFVWACDLKHPETFCFNLIILRTSPWLLSKDR